MEEERRRFIRWQVDREARIILEGEGQAIGCRLKDISFKGLRAVLTQRLESDAFIRFVLFLSEELILRIEGWVVWGRAIDKYNMCGIYFNKIPDSDKEKIYRFMQRYFPKQVYNRWWDGIIKQEKGGKEMEDRRLFERFVVQLPLRTLDLNSGKERRGQVYNISAKGLSFTADENLGVNTRLEIWLQIPDGKAEPFYTRGEVVWSEEVQPKKYNIGVDLERADLMGLSRVMRIT